MIQQAQAEQKVTDLMIRLRTNGIVQNIIKQQIVEAILADWSTGEILQETDDDVSLANKHIIVGIKTILNDTNLKLCDLNLPSIHLGQPD